MMYFAQELPKDQKAKTEKGVRIISRNQNEELIIEPGPLTQNQNTNQRLIQNYFREQPIRNEGCIENPKQSENTRILCINTNRFRLSENEKINQIIEFYKIS